MGSSTNIGSRPRGKLRQSIDKPKLAWKPCIFEMTAPFPVASVMALLVVWSPAPGYPPDAATQATRGLHAPLRAKTLLSWSKASLDSQIQINCLEQWSATMKSPHWQV